MRALKTFLMDTALVLLAIMAAVVLLMIGLAIAHYPAWRIIGEWATGAVGTPGDILVSLKNACPLILTGLAAGIAFRSGVFNIGAEGQSMLGAVFAVTIATRVLPNAAGPIVSISLALLAAALGGAAWALIAALLDRARGVPIVLSTILLNIIALQLLGILLEGPLKTHTSDIPQSDILPIAFQFPILIARPGGFLHVGFLIALLAAAITWLIQARTAFGFEILVTGLNPTAARFAGMPVAARQFAVMLISGAFAGFAGAIQVMGIEGHSLSPTPVSYGYAGIAVALLGRLHPAGIVVAALFFAFMDQGADSLQLSETPLPHEVADIVKGILVLMILVGTAIISRHRSMVRER